MVQERMCGKDFFLKMEGITDQPWVAEQEVTSKLEKSRHEGHTASWYGERGGRTKLWWPGHLTYSTQGTYLMATSEWRAQPWGFQRCREWWPVTERSGKMAQRLRTLVALSGDPSSVPSVCTLAAYDLLQLFRSSSFPITASLGTWTHRARIHKNTRTYT